MRYIIGYLLCIGIGFHRVSGQPPGAERPSPWAAGIFVLSDSQPYKGAGRSVRILPSVTYRGERLQWNGPLVQYHLFKGDKSTFSVNGVVQFAPYEQDDAPILEGMGDRSTTFLAGVDWTYRPIPSLTILASLDAEVLGAYNGAQAIAGFRYSIGKPWQRVSGSLGAGLLLQDQKWTRYFVGVPLEKATPERPEYSPGDSLHYYTTAQLLIRIYGPWSLFTLARLEFLDETWRDSPLIADEYRLMVFSALNYSF